MKSILFLLLGITISYTTLLAQSNFYYQRTACAEDTLDYVWTKAQGVGSTPIDSSFTTKGGGQIYYARDSVQVSGFYFYAYIYTPSNNNPTTRVKASVYQADSSGNPVSILAADTITIDTSFVKRNVASFSPPVTVTNNFVLTVNSIDKYSDDNVDSALRVYRTADGDGLNEDLSLLLRCNGGCNWIKVDSAFGRDFDFLFVPFVSYQVKATSNVYPRAVCRNDTVNFQTSISSLSQNNMFNQLYWDTIPSYPIAKNVMYPDTNPLLPTPIDSLNWNFTNQQTNLNDYYRLEFGDGNQTTTTWDTVYKYPNIGYYSIQVINQIQGWKTGICSETLRDTVKVGPVPTITQDTVFCRSDSTMQFSASGGNNYLWSPSNFLDDSSTASPVFSPPDTGVYQYTVSIEDTNLCSIDTGVTITVQGIPKANFIYSVSGLTVDFTNQSTFANTYVWDFDEGAPSTSKHPSHTYPQPGNYTVSLSIQGDCGVDVDTQTINVTGMHKITPSMPLTIYPNPAADQAFIKFDETFSQPINIKITDALGQNVYNQQFTTIQKNHTQRISTHHWPSGVYYIHVQSGSKRLTKKLTIFR